MRRIVKEHVSGGVNHDFRLWMLFNLEVWHRMFFDGRSVEDVEEWVNRMRGKEAPRAAAAPPRSTAPRVTAGV